MFVGEYDYDLDMQVKAEEAREEGAQQKAVEDAERLIKMNVLSAEQIAAAVELPLDQILELQKSISVEA